MTNYFMVFPLFFLLLLSIVPSSSIFYSGQYLYNDIHFHKKIFLHESEYERSIKKKAETILNKITFYSTRFELLKKIEKNKRSVIAMLSIWLTTITTTFPFMYDVDKGCFI
jgi:hypothetical protein